MVDKVGGIATDTRNKVDELLKNSPGDQALKNCVDKYNVVLQTNVPQASTAINQGNPNMAAQLMNDVGAKADSCETGFPSRSPVIDMNKSVLDMAAVAAAMAMTTH